MDKLVWCPQITSCSKSEVSANRHRLTLEEPELLFVGVRDEAGEGAGSISDAEFNTNLRKNLVVSETGKALNGAPGLTSPLSPMQTIAGQYGCRVLLRLKEDRGRALAGAWTVPA